MKRIITIIACAVLLAAGSIRLSANDGQTATAASDSRITWVGRTLIEGGNVSCDWSATYAKISFEGNYLAVNVSDTKKNYWNVWIDKMPVTEADLVIATEGENSFVTIADTDWFKQKYGKKGPKSHTAIIQKRTEGEQGKTTFHAFYTMGAMLQAPGLNDRMIEFIGDSYTCGYGSENSISTDPFTPETENSGKTYAALVARCFQADYVTVAHSGMGIVRNYNSKFPGYAMPERYLQVFDEIKEPAWDASANMFKPAMTVIYLGTNDFSTSLMPHFPNFEKAYLRLLEEVKANYGEDHPILCVASKRNLMFDYVRRVAEDCGMKNVEYLGFFDAVHHENNDELGASYHPNQIAHNKLAHAIAPYIATMTGWDLKEL